MSLNKELLIKIKQEIEQDPEKLGYMGKTATEIAQLMNNSVKKQRIIEETHPSRINQLFIQIAFTPNVIDAVDVIAAKNLII